METRLSTFRGLTCGCARRFAALALSFAAISCALAWLGATGALATAPRNGAPPEVEVPAGLGLGERLVCNPGSWIGSEIKFRFEWLRNGVTVLGATSSVHTIVNADRGTSLSCFVTASNKEGSGESESSNIVEVPLEVGARPEPTVAPVVSGNASVGAQLSCTTGKWTSTTELTFTYSWRRGHTAIPQATSSTYTVAEADAGYAIFCEVTATNRFGSTSSISSDSIKIPGAPVLLKRPAITGTALVGDQLTCSAGEWRGQPPPSFQYRWLRDGEPIALATLGTYTVSIDDVGHALACEVTATNELGKATGTSLGLTIPLTAALAVSDAQKVKGAAGGFSTGELSVLAGQTIEYRVTVRNTGNVQLKLTGFTDTGCVNVSGPGAGEIAPGESTTYTCEALLSSGKLTNQATVEATPPEGDGTLSPQSSNKVVAAVSTRPIVETGLASEVLQRTAALAATVNPNGKTITTCKFEYGATSLKSSAKCAKLPGSGSTAVAVTALAAGLTPGTTYHFRISATSASGSSVGIEGSFKTLPATPPSVKAEPATAISAVSAVLNATVEPNGGQVTLCKFEYGAISFSLKAACAKSPGSGTTPVAVSAAVKGLVTKTTYHFRITVVTPSGSSKAEGTFNTT